jgi:flagellar biosynthetic protein FliR
MEIFPSSYQELEWFLLILIRVSVILFMFPFFSARAIPVFSKAGLALIISVILLPVINHKMLVFPDSLWGLAQVMMAEMIVGMTLGLMVQMFFEGVRIMGQFVGFQTGFAIANILDPQSGAQVSILSNMAYLMAMVLFLMLNGHHIVLSAIRESFEIINVGGLSLQREIFQKIVRTSADMFVIAIRIGAPAIGALLFVKVVLGLITKLMPQMNVMIVAFPVQVVVGLFFFGICLGVLLRFMEGYLGALSAVLNHTMTWLRI